MLADFSTLQITPFLTITKLFICACSNFCKSIKIARLGCLRVGHAVLGDFLTIGTALTSPHLHAEVWIFPPQTLLILLLTSLTSTEVLASTASMVATLSESSGLVVLRARGLRRRHPQKTSNTVDRLWSNRYILHKGATLAWHLHGNSRMVSIYLGYKTDRQHQNVCCHYDVRSVCQTVKVPRSIGIADPRHVEILTATPSCCDLFVR